MNRACSCILTIVLLSFVIKSNSQSISPNIVGVNAWMTQRIGGYFEPIMSSRLGSGQASNKSMNANLVRIGGYSYSYDNTNGINSKEFLAELCKTVIHAGGEPILQIPHTISNSDLETWITYFKNNGLDIRNWLIGNEPDLKKVPLSETEAYTKRLSYVIKDKVPGASVFAVGMSQIVNMANNLWLIDNLGGTDDKGRYIIDYISMHDYESRNGGDLNWGNVDRVLEKINSLNNNRPGSKLGWILGEFNTTYSNNIVDQWLKTYSFYAGQVFTRIARGCIERGAYALFPWSIEENGSSRGDFDLGLFDASPSSITPRSTAVHWTMLGRTIRSTYIPVSAPNGAICIASCDSTGFSLMVANDKADACNFNITFSKSNMSLLDGNTYSVPAYSSKVFVFNAAGTLTGEALYTSTMCDARTEPASYPFVKKINRPDPCDTASVTTSGEWFRQAENFCISGGSVRSETCSDTSKGLNMGWIATGDSLTYNIKIQAAGQYTVSYRVASLKTTGKITLRDAKTREILDTISIKGSTGWQNWITLSHTTTLQQRVYNIVLVASSGEFNINWFSLKLMAPNTKAIIAKISTSADSTCSGKAPVNLDATGSTGDKLQYQWLAGDLVIGNQMVCSTALVSGKHEITLVVKDGLGKTDSTTKVIDVVACQLKQTIDLVVGWNLVSVNQEFKNSNSPGIFPNATEVKSTTAFYKPTLIPAFNSLTKLTPTEGYYVYNTVKESITVELTPLVEIPNSAINLKKGWNFIGTPKLVDVPVSALPNEVILIKNLESFYEPGNPLGLLSVLKPGHGYFVKVSADCKVSW